MAEKYCLNCGTPLTDAYCPHCGQKASVGRLTAKTAMIDNTWSALRMDSRVLSTAWLLLTRPWVVIRGYIYGQRVRYTQPLRFIVIMCFLSIIVQMFLPEISNKTDVAAYSATGGGFLSHLWMSVQGFLKESEVAQDLIDSFIFAPAVYLLFLPWGSQRFNLAEYSTAYLYLCGASLAIDLLLIPVMEISDDIGSLIQLGWWLYILSGMVSHSFRITPRWKLGLMILATIIVIVSIGAFNHIFLYGEI